MFNEKMHAFIPAVFYKELVKRLNGEQIFIFAAEKYGERRGSRMAQRVMRDKKELNFANYVKYGEWTATPGLEHSSKLISTTPDYSYNILSCPWHSQFSEMGCGDAGKVYCTYLDKAISRGYNPRLEFQVNSTLHTKNSCEFVLKEAYLDKYGDLTKEPQNIMSWEYHCADIFHMFANIVKTVCKDEGKSIVQSVLDAVAKQYGSEAADTLIKYENTDFSLAVSANSEAWSLC